jgi:hypothetical protein
MLEEADRHARELFQQPAGTAWDRAIDLFELCLSAAELVAGEVRPIIGRGPYTSRWLSATSALLDGAFTTAAQLMEEMGLPPYEALARLRAAESLVAAGSRAQADAQLANALVFWRSVGAKRYIRRAEDLLSRTA